MKREVENVKMNNAHKFLPEMNSSCNLRREYRQHITSWRRDSMRKRNISYPQELFSDFNLVVNIQDEKKGGGKYQMAMKILFYIMRYLHK